MRICSGLAASPGIAVGHLQVIDRRRLAIDEYPVGRDDVGEQISRLQSAISETRAELESLREHLTSQSGEEHLFFIDTHLLIISDDRLLTETISIIENALINAEGALHRVLQRYRDLFASIEDDYLRERINDIEIVVDKILCNMTGTVDQPIVYHEGKTIIVAHDLTPADILQMDRSRIIGIATEVGGTTSHASILARAFEIPAVVGIETIVDKALDGHPAILDGIGGRLIINPDSETFRDYLRRKQYYTYTELELLKQVELPSITPDGHRLSLKGNVEIPEEGASVLRHGGEGVGLYRTEMLFMGRRDMPSEHEQYQVYRAMQQAIAPHGLTIRTLDAGGDKFLDGTARSVEQNPALGVRAIRLALGIPQEFIKQLRAILRVSAHGPVRIMFPMISGLEELRQARSLLQQAMQELDSEEIPYDRQVPVGIMIEVPSAVQIADLLAREADFFSVGTNDLIQYSLAIDRSSEQLAPMFQPLHPAVLRSLVRVVEAARVAGIPTSICGEMAGNPLYLPILLGIGFEELSMSAGSIPRVKQVLRRCPYQRAVEVARACLSYDTSADVELFLKRSITRDIAESCD